MFAFDCAFVAQAHTPVKEQRRLIEFKHEILMMIQIGSIFTFSDVKVWLYVEIEGYRVLQKKNR